MLQLLSTFLQLHNFTNLSAQPWTILSWTSSPSVTFSIEEITQIAAQELYGIDT